MASQPQSVNPEVRAKFSQMREDVKKVTNRLGDIEAQQAEYAYVIDLNAVVQIATGAHKKSSFCC